MSDSKRYNGWTNYETWAVNLWLTNEQSSSEYWHEQAESVWASSATDPDACRNARIALADQLKDEVETAAQDVLESAHESASLWSDLLNAALSDVAWFELADAWLSDIHEYVSKEAVKA